MKTTDVITHTHHKRLPGHIASGFMKSGVISIYRITCIAKGPDKGRTYVGATSQKLSERWYQHWNHALNRQTHCVLARLIRKYGPDGFEIKLLDQETNPQLAMALETNYTQFFKSHVSQGGLNECYGTGRSGYTVTKASRRKVSRSMSGKGYGGATWKKGLKLYRRGGMKRWYSPDDSIPFGWHQATELWKEAH